MNGEMTKQFTVCFQQATGHRPYPFQVRFACEPSLFQNPSPLEGEGRVRGAWLLQACS